MPVQSFFFANKSSVADSVVIRQTVFTNNRTDLIVMTEEKDNKGYYNAERIVFTGNTVRQLQGRILDVYRGGNDESTMGPALEFSQNKLEDCMSQPGEMLVHLYGVQQSIIANNSFTRCNENEILLKIEDIVKARHWLKGNNITRSGTVIKNNFTTESAN
jgi:poly(beta-D-mannuronate) lyase